MLTIIDRNGPPEAITCPAFLCDACHEPVYADGMAIWEVPEYEGNRPGPFTVYTVHKGVCDRAFEKATGKHYRWRELGEFVKHLMNNVEEPFKEEPGVEYIAPSPSTWKLGHYERKK